jgi:hypothetical protein
MRYFIASLALLLSVQISTAQGRRVHVDAYATGLGNGSSWDNAFTDLQSALFAAQPGDQVWVALGTYKPTEGYNRDLTFRLKSGVKLYGGFSGVETDLKQRNWDRYKTVLSGNIGAENSTADNSYTILLLDNATAETVVDGFTFVGGRADSQDPSVSPFAREKSGSALYIALENEANYPAIRNCSFEHNYARAFGGAVYCYAGEEKEVVLDLDNCWFVDNRADGAARKSQGAASALRVFPNPTTGVVTVEGAVAQNAAFPLQLSLFDAAGKPVQTVDIQGSAQHVKVQVPLNTLPAGWYNFNVSDAAGALMDAGKLWKQ